jgi:hypothetical protein
MRKRRGGREERKKGNYLGLLSRLLSPHLILFLPLHSPLPPNQITSAEKKEKLTYPPQLGAACGTCLVDSPFSLIPQPVYPPPIPESVRLAKPTSYYLLLPSPLPSQLATDSSASYRPEAEILGELRRWRGREEGR